MPNLFELIANEQRQNRAKLDRRQAALDEVKSVSAFDPEAGSADNFLNGVKKNFSETWQQTEITLGQLVNNDPETWQAVEDGAVGAAEWAWGTVTLDKETWSNTADAVKGAVGDAVDYGKAVIDAPDDPRAAYEAGQGALGVATTFVPGVGVAGKATKVADKAGDLGDAGRKAAAKRGSEAPDQPPCTTGACKKDTYRRPSGFRKGVREKVFQNARGPDGHVRNPGTEEIIKFDDPWDMGHKPGYEFRKHKKSAENRGITRKRFIDEHNNLDHYRPEIPKYNRSHSGEDMTDLYLGP